MLSSCNWGYCNFKAGNQLHPPDTSRSRTRTRALTWTIGTHERADKRSNCDQDHSAPVVAAFTSPKWHKLLPVASCKLPGCQVARFPRFPGQPAELSLCAGAVGAVVEESVPGLVTGRLALLAHFALTIFLRLWMSDRLQTSKPKQNYLRWSVCQGVMGWDGMGLDGMGGNWMARAGAAARLANCLSGHSTTWSLPIVHDERSVLAFTCYMATACAHWAK